MALRKQRILQDLYNVTRTLSQPKITPVLRGNCQMQGPVDDTECDFNTNMVSLHADEEYNSYSKNLKSGLRAESGTCNVCSAPCSSCLHINRHLMGSKSDECFGETCNESALSFSVDDAVQNDKIEKCETGQKSRTQNLVSVNLSNTSENVDCEASLKNSDTSTASEDVVLLKFDDSEGKEDFDHYVSGDAGIKETKLSNFNVGEGDRAELSNSPASDSSLTPQENRKEVTYLDVECYVAENRNNSGREIKNSEESLEQVPLSMCSQSDASLQKSGSVGASSINAVDASPSLKALDDLSHPPCGKSLSCGPSSLESEGNLCAHFNGGLLASPSKHLNSFSMNEVNLDVVNGDPAVDSLDYEGKNEDVHKFVGAVPLPVAKGNALESNPTFESDDSDSDMVEHDVKVCDICGDAGREDLLAICCRCTDGAEHTYCMQEMLDKVPEDYWLCEECKADAETKNQKQDTVSSAGLNEICSSGQVNAENVNFSMKSEGEGSDAEGNRSSKDPSSGVKISGKRHIEDGEVSSAAKKRALDHIVGTTKMLASNSLAALSRDSSFKNLDRGNTWPAPQSSPCTISAPELTNSSASTSLLQTPQGTFIKSNSFNSLNSKPKVKLVDNVVPQKQRSVRGPASLNKKEGAARQISKSLSFKFANSSRLNISDSKVKMLSPKFSPSQDIKGSKQTKDRSLFERKIWPSVNSHLGGSSVFAAKKDKQLASSDEPNLLASVKSYRDTKVVQSDSKSMTLSRSSSFVARKASEMPVSFGESKRQSSLLTSSIGVSSTNEINSRDLKPNLSGSKEDSSSSSSAAERPPCNANECVQDGLYRPRESSKFGERGKESSVSRPKQSSTIGGRTVSCHKCKEFGHLAQSCTPDCPSSAASDASAGKSSREMMDCKDKLKAAIEAAVLRKPGIYRKQRVTDQPDDVSPSSLNCEIASQNHVMNSSNKGNVSTAEEPEAHMILGNYTAESCKQPTIDNLKQLTEPHVESSSLETGDAFSVIPSEGLFSKDMPGHVPATMSLLLKTLAIPDHDYIWQGVFEICRSGKNLNLCDGIQAHSSSCASPKVLDAVNKFPRKVLLNEVPRLSTWPVQFQEYGVKEDNIALFFFAKDLSSYEKSYKILLDNMMKNDLALKGNLNDVELMIFPSNQLPEKSQRWNTLFFLWGVFRGKRSDCSEHMPSSQKQICIPQDPTALLSLPENLCTVRPVDKDLPERRDLASTSNIPALKELPHLSSARMWNGDGDTILSSQVPPNYHTRPIVEKQDHRLDSSCFSIVQSSSLKSCEEAVDKSISCEDLTHSNPSLDVHVETDDKLEPELHAPAEANRRVGYNKSEQMPMHRNWNLNGNLSLHEFDESPADEHGRASLRGMDGRNITDNMSNSRCQEDLADVKDNHRKRQLVDSVVRIPKATCPSISQVTTGNSPDNILVEEITTSKKQKTEFCAFNRGTGQANSPVEGLISTIHSGSPIRANAFDEAINRTDVLVFEGNAARYLFPFDPRTDVGQDGEALPWRISPFEEDRLHDRAPNLELALGAETKPSSQSIPPFLVRKEDKKVIQDHCLHDPTTKGEDDDVSASLSLSLSFPFPDEEQRVKSVSEAEQQHVNTSLLLFGGLRDK